MVSSRYYRCTSIMVYTQSFVVQCFHLLERATPRCGAQSTWQPFYSTPPYPNYPVPFFHCFAREYSIYHVLRIRKFTQAFCGVALQHVSSSTPALSLD